MNLPVRRLQLILTLSGLIALGVVLPHLAKFVSTPSATTGVEPLLRVITAPISQAERLPWRQWLPATFSPRRG